MSTVSFPSSFLKQFFCQNYVHFIFVIKKILCSQNFPVCYMQMHAIHACPWYCSCVCIIELRYEKHYKLVCKYIV